MERKKDDFVPRIPLTGEERDEIRAILESTIVEQLRPETSAARGVGVVYTDPPGVCWPLQG